MIEENSQEIVTNKETVDIQAITRRKALSKIAKFSTYTAPVVLLTISGKVMAAS